MVSARRSNFILISLGILLTLAASVYSPQRAAAAEESIESALIIGVTGLVWEDVSKKDTPNLVELAKNSGVGNLSIRSGGSLTCPIDGWVTVGAGNRAVGTSHPDKHCGRELGIEVPAPEPDGSARFAEQSEITVRNEQRSFGARPGTFASSVKCVSAIGLPAVAGASRTTGRVEHYAPEIPRDAEEFLTRCPVTMADLGEITGEIGSDQRRADLRAFDAQLATLLAARPAHTMTMVIGVADLQEPPQLHVSVLNAPGFQGRWLTSASTNREPFIQLIDVAPTVLRALSMGIPHAIVGQPINSGSERGESFSTTRQKLVKENTAAVAQRPLVPQGFTVLVWANIALLLAATVFFRQRQRAVGETLPDPAAGHAGRLHLLNSVQELRFARILEWVCLGLAALPVSTYIAQLLPWYTWPSGALWYITSIAAVTVAIAMFAGLSPWASHPLGAPSVIGIITGGVLGLDVLAGSHLQLDSIFGYSPLVGGRFTGFGNIAFAVFAAGALIGAIYAVHTLPRWRAVTIASGVGIVCIILVGSPMWGNDVGGVLALTPAFVLAVMRLSGMWLNLVRVLAALALGAVVIGVFAFFDYQRPEDERTHLGRFVQQLMDGTAATVLQRKAEANLSLLISSQLTLLVIAVALFIPLVLMRRSAGLWRVFGLYPASRAASIGVLTAAVLGFVLNDSGIAVPAFLAAVTVPLLLATVLRVLRYTRLEPHRERHE